MEETSTVEISALQAKAIATSARTYAYKNAMMRINEFAKMGLNEAPLIGMWLDLADVEKLMQAGFSVSTFQNMDHVTFYKVSW